MPEINPGDFKSPIPEAHLVVLNYAGSIWDHLGSPAFPIRPVKLRGEIHWTVLWFINGANNNFSVVYTKFGTLHVKIHSSEDPHSVEFHVHAPELLAEYLTRFTPDHWKASA